MNIADIMIHVHPELSADQRKKIEEDVGGKDGIMSVHFSTDHAHELTVAYNPEVTSSGDILEQVRQWDKEAMMAGL